MRPYWHKCPWEWLGGGGIRTDCFLCPCEGSIEIWHHDRSETASYLGAWGRSRGYVVILEAPGINDSRQRWSTRKSRETGTIQWPNMLCFLYINKEHDVYFQREGGGFFLYISSFIGFHFAGRFLVCVICIFAPFLALHVIYSATLKKQKANENFVISFDQSVITPPPPLSHPPSRPLASAEPTPSYHPTLKRVSQPPLQIENDEIKEKESKLRPLREETRLYFIFPLRWRCWLATLFIEYFVLKFQRVFV